MKKISLFAIIAMMILSSCQKESADAVSGNTNGNANLVTPPANVTSTVVVTPSSAPSAAPTVEPFNAKFTIEVPDPINIFENQTLRLVSTSGNVVHYYWSINNARNFEAINPSLSFPWHGMYNIKLTVVDANGVTATSSQDVSILCNFMHNPGQ